MPKPTTLNAKSQKTIVMTERALVVKVSPYGNIELRKATLIR